MVLKPVVISRATARIARRHAVECHPERSEGSDSLGTEILRCAQDDMRGWTVLVALHIKVERAL